MAKRQVSVMDELSLVRSLCRESFEDFVREFWEEVPGAGTKFQWGFHMTVLCNELQEIAERVFKNLPKDHDTVVNISPGTSKSTIASILFQPWVWSRMPQARFITASHTEDLTLDLANKSRAVLLSDKYRAMFPDIVLNKEAMGYYTNTLGGDRKTCTVGGKSPMGFHAHFIICLPYEAIIHTRVGGIQIGKIVENKIAADVYSFDHDQHECVYKNIEAFETSVGRQIWRIVFHDGGVLRVTGNHPVYVVRRGYVEASCLLPGDRVLKANEIIARDVTVVAVFPEKTIPDKVYNIRVASTHNYFADGILVHNCDDPIDPKKAMSEAELASAKYFYDAVIPSRKVDKSVSVEFTIMQRLAEEDPTAHILKRAKRDGTSKVRHVCLPAEIPVGSDGEIPENNVRPPELAMKYVNGIMDPNRLPRSVLDEAKATMGVYWFSAQYNQTPVPLGGGMFRVEWFSNRVKAAPYESLRIRYWDRACLLSNCTVSTSVGLKRIEDIVVNDMVLTRGGYKPVLWSGRTKSVSELTTVLFSDGSTVTGTADHRVWTENRGWVPLAFLCFDDYIGSVVNLQRSEAWPSGEDRNGIQTRNSLYLMELSTVAVQKKSISKLCDGTKTINGITPKHCTKPFGSFIMGISPLVILSTTLTKTEVITQSRILSASLVVSMGKDTAIRCERMPLFYGQIKNIRCESVLSVKRSLARALLNFMDCFVHTGVGASPNEFRRRVRIAIQDLWRIPKQRIVPENVLEIGNEGVPVYDLEVEDAYEFFANGILVHNSTSDGGCYTAGVLMAKANDGNFYIEHLVHGQWEPDRRNEIMKATALQDRSRYGPSNDPYIYVEAEGGSSGRDAWKGVVRALAGFAVFEDRVSGNKDRRAEPWAAQLAARNVVLVDDGTWDIQALIDEHIRFRPEEGVKRGRYKDICDSCSGAFNLMVGQLAPSFRVLGSRKLKTSNRIVVCTHDELASLQLEQKSILVSFDDLPEYNATLPPAPPTLVSYVGCIDRMNAAFADAEPTELQEKWSVPVDEHGTLPKDIVMRPEDGKRVWAFLLRKRDPLAEVFVFADGGGRRAYSAALAVCDMLRLPRSAVFRYSQPDTKCEGDAPSKHVYETIKYSRGLVAS